MRLYSHGVSLSLSIPTVNRAYTPFANLTLQVRMERTKGEGMETNNMARRSKEYLRTIHTRYRQAERAEKAMMSLKPTVCIHPPDITPLAHHLVIAVE
jgi:hypothetical protein